MRGQSPEIVRPVPTRETPEMARSRTSVGINNTLAVRHGSQSPAIVALNTPAVVRDVINALAAEIPYLEPAHMLLVEQTARLPTRIRLIEDHLDRLGGCRRAKVAPDSGEGPTAILRRCLNSFR